MTVPLVVIALNNNKSLSSLDHGVTWTPGTMPVSTGWIDVCWNGTVFCAISQSSNDCALSTDGINWVAGGSLPVSGYDGGIMWNGTVLLAVKSTGVTARSYDNGLSWVAGVCTGGYGAGTSGSGNFLIQGTASNVLVSSDGINWASHPLPFAGIYTPITYNGTKFCTIRWFYSGVYHDDVCVSTDGVNWATSNVGEVGNYTTPVWNGAVYCVVTSLDKAYTSPDGVVWTYKGTSSGMYGRLYTDGTVFLAFPAFSTAARTSINGVSWASHPFSPSASWYSGAQSSVYVDTGSPSFWQSFQGQREA